MSPFAACWIVLLYQTGTVAALSVQEYFPEIGSNLTLVTWGHAVNSQQKLRDALSEKLMMLEADVVLGSLKGGSGVEIPVMAHPPDDISDLSLKNFLTEVKLANQKGHRCGIKLDFKTVEVLKPALLQLLDYKQLIDFPIMLNADILPGPVNSTTKPVDLKTFIELSSQLFPSGTLSLGWTTRYGGLIDNGSYTEEQVETMRDALSRYQVKQPVTFPVRAGMVANSGATLAQLMNIPNSTFTIWSADNDTVNVPRLREVILDVLGRDRVFVDVPDSLSAQLQLTPNSTQRDSSSAAVTLPSVTAVLVAMVTLILNKFK